MNYPLHIIATYRDGGIDRQQFAKQFSDWQKSRGINYDGKGTVDRFGIHLTYRGVKATVRNGTLCFIIKDDNGKRHYIKEQATTPFEFRRRIDFALGRLQCAK